MRPSVVSASKSGAVSPIVRAIRSSLPRVELRQFGSIFSPTGCYDNIPAGFDGPTGVVGPLRPRAGIEPAAADARVLHDEEVVAGRDAGAARRDDRRFRAFDPDRGEAAAQLVDRQEAPVRVDVLARGQAPRAG